MSDLSREARDAIEAGARALAPSDAARAKIRAAVAARVSGTPGAGGGEGAGGASVAAAGGAAGKIWLAALVLGGIAAAVLGARWYLQGARGHPPAAAARAEGPAPAAPPVAAPTTSAAAAAPPVAAPAPGRARPAARRPRPARPAPATTSPERAGSTLEQEVALLSEARRALRDGEPARALAALARHRREIRRPQMAKEAALLRAEALCADDRAGEGRAVLEDIDARWPGAAGAAAVRARCGEE